MKYLKTFEYLMNDKLYRIEVYDKNEPINTITTTTVTGKNDKYSVETDFKKSHEFLRIKKDNPNIDLEIRISDLQDSFMNMLNKKKVEKFEKYNPTTSLYRIIIRDLNRKTAPDKGVILSMKTRSELSKDDVEKEFLNSKTFLDIKKKNPNVDFHVKVDKIDDYDAVKDLELIKIY
jgi:hypothetical protein